MTAIEPNAVPTALCPTLGITGGVASGKSTLARGFEQLGASRISADEIARDLLAPGSETTHLVLREFGPEIRKADAVGEIDRRSLARLIYTNEVARRILGEIIHPPIRERMRAQIANFRAAASCSLIVVEIPLLYENGLESMVNSVLVASCSEATQVHRLRARQPWLSEHAALQQVRSQLPLTEKASRADYVISTELSMDEVELAAAALYRQLARTTEVE